MGVSLTSGTCFGLDTFAYITPRVSGKGCFILVSDQFDFVCFFQSVSANVSVHKLFPSKKIIIHKSKYLKVQRTKTLDDYAHYFNE